MSAPGVALLDPQQAGVFFVLDEDLAPLEAAARSADLAVRRIDLRACRDKAALLERAKNSWQQALQGWAKLLPEREELERQLALVAGARVEVGAGIEGAIDLAFGKKVLRMRRAYGSGSLSIAGEQVVFTDAAGNHLPVS